MYTHLQRDASRPPVTLATLARMKADGEKIASLTCYDASFAVLLDAADVDVVLVGDSLGMVIQGHNTTVPVTMDHMVYHSAAVARGLHRPFLIADLPFMSYPSQTQALEHSVRLMQQGGAQMVKLESGGKQTEIVEFLASHDIAVCAHVGLKPQSVHKTGGFRVQGRERETAARLLEEARRLESAGADIVLLECIPAALGKAITAALHVPVIGIGAGPDTDGQILVTYDMLDITTGRKPRFVRNFMDGARDNLEALQHYVRAVKQGEYPAPEHCFERMLAAAGCDLMFMPEVSEIYPHGAERATRVEVPALSRILDGEFRPGHFEGVSTVVAKLFHIVEPDVAVFGEKDFQQLAIIRRMVTELCMPVEIIAATTVRDADGLAMSSRNQYLTAEERALAPTIYATLQAAASRVRSGDADFASIERAGLQALDSAGFRPDYFAVRQAADLSMPTPGTRELVVLTAARLGKARLIDNVQGSRS